MEGKGNHWFSMSIHISIYLSLYRYQLFGSLNRLHDKLNRDTRSCIEVDELPDVRFLNAWPGAYYEFQTAAQLENFDPIRTKLIKQRIHASCVIIIRWCFTRKKQITSLRVIPTVTSYWHIFVTNPDILCAKIWRGREGEDNSDEIKRPSASRFHQNYPLLLVPSPGSGSSSDHCDLSDSNWLALRLIPKNIRRPGVSRRLGVSRRPGVSRRLGVSPPRPFSWFGAQQWPLWSIKPNWFKLTLVTLDSKQFQPGN